MRKKQVWRYYCDFCRKGKFTESAMCLHEEHCTLNPERKCRMCGYAGGTRVAVTELVKLLPGEPDQTIDADWTPIKEATEAAIPKLREAAGNCPACIFAALRQAGMRILWYSNFDFKSECKELWANVNDEQYGRDYE